jgi:hypothetical protein
MHHQATRKAKTILGVGALVLLMSPVAGWSAAGPRPGTAVRSLPALGESVSWLRIWFSWATSSPAGAARQGAGQAKRSAFVDPSGLQVQTTSPSGPADLAAAPSGAGDPIGDH